MIYVYDHNTGEKFSISDLAQLVEWLNNVDDNYSFSLKGFDDLGGE